MKNLILFTALAAGTNALVPRGAECCFHLFASGGASGEVRQLSDGQNRIGDNSLPIGDFCISKSGTLTDSHGRGCILTPPTTQFQCDVGATPTPGFSITPAGLLEHNGSPHFIACQTGDHGGMNIHSSEPIPLGQCVNIHLTADSCHPSTPPPPPPPPPKTCPTTLTSGSFEFPHLIVPISSAAPNKAFGTSFNGEVTPTISSIFNFDIPQTDAGKTCSLVFLFPNKADLKTSSFTFSGDGKIDFEQLVSPATTSTTFNNAPAVAKNLGELTVSPGHSFVVSTFACPAGKKIAFEMKNAGTTHLEFFQDFNPAPIGLFITTC